ncbi:hypothetical protein CU097_000880, partial [Rhizopus azygosporus]
ESTSKIDILPNTPQTPLTELNPLQDYYDDDEDDYYNHNTNYPEQHDDHQSMDGSHPYLRNRSYSYQYNRMPHHLSHEHMARKQSLGNLSSSNNLPPRHFMNGIPGMTLPPLPRNSSQEIPENYIKIKTHYNGSIYVVVVPLTIEFGELKKKIENKLRLCIQESAISVSVLKYEDEDGDLVTMNSTDDVQMGFETKGPNNVVNFHVTAVC